MEGAPPAHGQRSVPVSRDCLSADHKEAVVVVTQVEAIHRLQECEKEKVQEVCLLSVPFLLNN
jgi:hypothetical protein